MSAHIFSNAFITSLVLAFAVTASAQELDDQDVRPREPFYGLTDTRLIGLLTNAGVQQELRLEEGESQKLLESLRQINPTNMGLPEVRQQHLAKVMERFAAARDETLQKCEAAIKESLSEDQFRRLKQLDLQRQGARAFLKPQTAQQLDLTAEQQGKLNTINQERLLEHRANRASIAAGEPRPTEAQETVRREKFEAELFAVLTPEQAKQWSAMTGTPFSAPKPSLESPGQLVLGPEVQKELGLSEGEAVALLQSLKEIQKEVLAEAGRSNLPSLKESELQQKFEETVDAVRSSLTVSQWNRLQELLLQETGATSFAQPEVAKKLGLSREQRNQVRKMVGEYHLRGLIPARQPKDKAEVLNILTPEQAHQWEAMQGVKVDPSMFRPGPSPAKQ